MQKLRTKLTKGGTLPRDAEDISTCLTQWRITGRVDVNLFDRRNTFYSAILKQRNLGWHNFMMGRLHQEWLACQTNYLLSIGSRRSPFRWVVSVIRQFQNTVWDMWQHRNSILHQPDGPRAREELWDINRQINKEYAEGFTELSESDRRRLVLPRSKIFHAQSMDQKRLWLQEIQIARNAAQNEEDKRRRQWFRERNFMRAWLDRKTQATTEH